jgi:hypothetical protein
MYVSMCFLSCNFTPAQSNMMYVGVFFYLRLIKQKRHIDFLAGGC